MDFMERDISEGTGNLIDTFTEEQQAQVLNLMSIGNIDDMNLAARILSDSNFDIDLAAKKIIEIQASLDEPVKKNLANKINEDDSPIKPDDLYTLYKKHLENKIAEEESSWVSEPVKKSVTTVVSGVKSVWNSLVPTSIRGESTGGEQFLTYFRKHYENLNKELKFNIGTFEENIQKANEVKRPLLVYVHVDAQENRLIPPNILGNPTVMNPINIKYHLLGLLAESDGARAMTKYIDISINPILAVFRVNLLDEVQMMESIELTSEIKSSEVAERLKNLEQNFYLLMAEEEKIKSQVKKLVEAERAEREIEVLKNNPTFEEDIQYQNLEEYGVQPHLQHQPNDFISEQQKLEDDRVLRQIHESESEETERKMKERKLKEAEEEAIEREKEEEEEEIRLTQLDYEKKKLELEKSFLEPSKDEDNTINIVFKLPDGTTIERKFRNKDKVEGLYLFVDLHYIPLTGKKTLGYELIQPLPFVCLDNFEKTLFDYFQGSEREVVHVREKSAEN